MSPLHDTLLIIKWHLIRKNSALFIHDIQFHSLGHHALGLVDTKVQQNYKRPGHGPLGTSGKLEGVQVWASWAPWDAK